MGYKWDESGPGEKLLRLYTTLMVSQYPLSLKELTERMNCSKQTVSRLVNLLEASEFGKVICEKKGRANVYRLDAPKNFPRFSLNGRGLAQLALCREFLLKLLPPKMLQSMEQSLDEAVAYLPPHAQPFQKEVATSLSKGHIDYSPFEDILNTILKGITERKICSAGYRASRSKPEKRHLIAPKRLIAFHESIFVSAFILDEENQPKYKDATILALQRFTRCELTTTSADHISEPEWDETQFLGVKRKEPFEVVARFSPGAATYVAERQWSAGQTITENEDGSIILRLMANNSDECISWILGFGPSATLLEPEWLKKLLQEQIGQMYNLYQ